jgi:hypothetical protein
LPSNSAIFALTDGRDGASSPGAHPAGPGTYAPLTALAFAQQAALVADKFV